MSEWIKCSERLPTAYHFVLITAMGFDEDNYLAFAKMIPNGDDTVWVTYFGGLVPINDEVIAWMPLPEPPKEVWITRSVDNVDLER